MCERQALSRTRIIRCKSHRFRSSRGEREDVSCHTYSVWCSKTVRVSQLAIVSAFLITIVATAWLLRSRIYRSMLDVPNDRSLHSAPTPRAGGLAILIGIVAGVVIYFPDVDDFQAVMMGLALGALLAVSILDDIRGTPVLLRLAIHFLSAAIVLGAGLGSHVSFSADDWFPDVMLWLGSLFFLVWMTNLYNFMDGMDGFAGGMAVVGFGTFGVLAWIADSASFMTLSFIVAAAASGFLLFNFPPARIFMGDTGSSVLGFLAGIFILWADRLRLFPFWIGLLVFSPFIVDATVTLLRRLVAGERVWEAHKTHYYQRLVQLGWGHRKTTLVEYAVMLLAALGAITAAQSPTSTQWLVIALFGVLYSTAAAIIAAMEKRAETVRNTKH